MYREGGYLDSISLELSISDACSRTWWIFKA